MSAIEDLMNKSKEQSNIPEKEVLRRFYEAHPELESFLSDITTNSKYYVSCVIPFNKNYILFTGYFGTIGTDVLPVAKDLEQIKLFRAFDLADAEMHTYVDNYRYTHAYSYYCDIVSRLYPKKFLRENILAYTSFISWINMDFFIPNNCSEVSDLEKKFKEYLVLPNDERYMHSILQDMMEDTTEIITKSNYQKNELTGNILKGNAIPYEKGKYYFRINGSLAVQVLTEKVEWGNYGINLLFFNRQHGEYQTQELFYPSFYRAKEIASVFQMIKAGLSDYEYAGEYYFREQSCASNSGVIYNDEEEYEYDCFKISRGTSNTAAVSFVEEGTHYKIILKYKNKEYIIIDIDIALPFDELSLCNQAKRVLSPFAVQILDEIEE